MQLDNFRGDIVAVLTLNHTEEIPIYVQHKERPRNTGTIDYKTNTEEITSSMQDKKRPRNIATIDHKTNTEETPIYVQYKKRLWTRHAIDHKTDVSGYFKKHRKIFKKHRVKCTREKYGSVSVYQIYHSLLNKMLILIDIQCQEAYIF